VDSIRFLAPAFPGDLLCVGVTIAEIDPGLFRVDARIENAAQKTIAVAKFQVGLGDHSDD
jgi:acyl dehydratase